MEIYTPKPKIKLSPVVRNGREFVEVTFGNDNDIRLSLSKEENVLLVGGRAYLPAENFVLAEFFDRYVKMAFIDYSAIKETAPRKEEDKRPPLPEGYLEKLQQVRYSDHTVRVYTSYFRDFQQYFEGRKIETVTPGEINDYLLYLIHEKNISSVPRDFSKVKSKVAFNLTARQLICFGAAAVVGVPLFFVLRDTAGNSGATLGMMAVMLPMFFLAMYQKNGQPAEKILRYYFQARFVRPKVRPYQTRNYYALLMKGDDTHDSVSEKE